MATQMTIPDHVWVGNIAYNIGANGRGRQATPEEQAKFERQRRDKWDAKIGVRPSHRDAREFVSRECGSYLVLDALLMLQPRMKRKDWLRLVGKEWNGCDNIAAHKDALRLLLGEETHKEMMTASERRIHAALPETVTIYRGCGAHNIDGACWSLSRETAERFPSLNRYKVADPLLVTATVAKSKILAVKTDRDEDEVITFSASVVSVEQIAAASSVAGVA
jgi:hypothetical protein